MFSVICCIAKSFPQVMRKWSKPGLPFQPIGQGGDAIFDGTRAAASAWMARDDRASAHFSSSNSGRKNRALTARKIAL
jgi:hypothetical protein